MAFIIFNFINIISSYYYHYYYCQFILCWQGVTVIQLQYLHNRSHTKNGMLIKFNKLKLT